DSRAQRVSPNPPSEAARRVAGWTDGLVVAGAPVTYHRSQGSRNTLAWIDAVELAASGVAFDQILAAAYPDGRLATLHGAGRAGLAGSLARVMAAAAYVFAADTIELQTPRGGWIDSGLADTDEVHAAYPKPPVDRGGQRHRALIQGRIRAAGTARRPPYTFIVNGNPMLLYTDEAGYFSKPWAFGRGSNSVEVRSPDGTERRRLQFYERHAGKTPARIRL